MNKHLPLPLLIAFVLLLSSCETKSKQKTRYVPAHQIAAVFEKKLQKELQNVSPSEIKAIAQMLEKAAPTTIIDTQLPGEFSAIENAVLAVDTSGSMLEFPSKKMNPEVRKGIKIFIERMVRLKRLVVFDLDGNPISSWTTKDRAIPGIPEDAIDLLLSKIDSFKWESQSVGMIKLIESTNNFRNENLDDSEIRLIVFGDEFSTGAERFLLEIETWKTLAGDETYPIDLIEYDFFHYKSDIDSLGEIKRGLRTNEKFELFGRYLAGVTGGYFLKFERKEN